MDRAHALHALAATRWRVAISLTISMLAIYFGFILLVAFNKPLLATLLTRGLSLGIVLGASTIVSAWVLVLIYVRWANSTYDARIRELRG